MFETITDKLTIVHGGAKTQEQLMADGQVMQNWVNCNNDVQAKLNAGSEAAMAKAKGGAVTQGMTDLLAAGATAQAGQAACSAKFPIK
jgi:hypothetical protein